MGNASSVLQENNDLKKQVQAQQTVILQLEHTIKRLEQENFELKKQNKQYAKNELLSLTPRPERDEDVL